ncbi:hypothetical protein CROQUDRAFT_662846 [Cronartium quercuum f. sp. fusiforme G11]|uniref:Uncharacterized protein n=1 Tax=Cronartium quercuum f. sp. fusiforme G11 TaxID=708437 RepID=A0A9P6T7M3_9BASI|nr:hypothetical protein CROQUDRAFT_662846 [Cronartium quercuum f. sp. fusiforme G11]
MYIHLISFQRKVKEEKLKMNLYSANAILNNPAVFPLLAEYVLATWHFEHLCLYLPNQEPSLDG